MMKKILLYSELGRGNGGAESVFESVSNGLNANANGVEVHKVYQNSDILNGILKKDNNEWDINLFVPSRMSVFFRPKAVPKFLASLLSLFILIYRVRPDVINCHFWYFNYLHFAILKKIFGYRLVLSCHGTDVKNVWGLKERSSSYVFKNTDMVTFVSNKLREEFEKKISSNVNTCVIYNGIDLEYWKSNQTYKVHNKFDKKNVQIVTVGALRRVKGHDVLIEALGILKGKTNFNLKIIGEGPKRLELENLIEENGLTHNVELIGHAPPSKIKEELYKSSVFVFPSRNEGLPLALLEAMATGLPVVASNTGGIPEVLEGTPALLVKPGSKHHLAKALSKILNDATWMEKTGLMCKEKTKMFSMNRMVEEYFRVLIY